MPKETIGYYPEVTHQQTSLAELPELRKTEPAKETYVKFVNLNPFDQQLSQLPEELLDAIASNMASKDISAESFES